MKRAIERRPPDREAIQRARGGVEYTEGPGTTLHSHAGGGAPNAVAPVATDTFGETTVEAYQVPTAQMGAWAGPPRDDERTLVTLENLKLTNDTHTAEWVIEAHQNDLEPEQLVNVIKGNLALMFGLRRLLREFVLTNTIANNETVLAPAGTGNIQAPGPQGLFRYRTAAASAGRVQVTVQYGNVDTIGRINELNASKFLTGTKVEPGQDANRVAGTLSVGQVLADFAGTTSSSTASALRTALAAASANLTAGGTTLTAAQIGLIKLMVINDAMASTQSRFRGIAGEAQEKNMQRFFPKSQRQAYIAAVARGAVPGALLAALRTVLVGAQDTMAQAVWNRADPFALAIDEPIRDKLRTDLTTALHDPSLADLARDAAPNIGVMQVTLALAAIRDRIRDEILGGRSARAGLIALCTPLVTALGIANPDDDAIASVAVDTALATSDTVGQEVAPLTDTRRENSLGRATSAEEKTAIKDFILGANGSLLAPWIGRAALAYTDATGAAGDHVGNDGVGNVIQGDRGFTPVAGGGQGAIYEFREREIDIADGDTAALEAALAKLFGAA